MRVLLLLAAALSLPLGLTAADKYLGPKPPKADIPYLLHADTLVETEAVEAREETRKDATIAVIPGATARAKTPLAEPIFIIRTDKLSAERLAAFKMDVKNGNREVVIAQKKQRNAPKQIYLNATRLADNLWKVEVDQTLENGQYTLSPEGSNQTFSFEVY
ncbi:MAG: hypothetical protein ABI822_24070 [Bryobacteraceae bacterium]